jgi:ubiquinone/menaquinone biosynthesis C-methylase UbiE
MARFYDRVMEGEERRNLGRFRRELLSDVQGRVLEVGAGTGCNLELYPDELRDLTVAEPDPHMRAQLQRKFPSQTVSPAALGDLPFDAGSFDAVVCTLVLCTVRDPAASLADVRRVLKPGGRLVFMEHVRDEAFGVKTAQRIAQPLWKRVAGGCHLTRDTEGEMRRAGFRFEWIERDPLAMRLPLVRSVIRGAAVPE